MDKKRGVVRACSLCRQYTKEPQWLSIEAQPSIQSSLGFGLTLCIPCGQEVKNYLNYMRRLK